MRVLFRAPVGTRTGYGQAAHDYILALMRAGIEVEVESLAKWDERNIKERYRDIIPLIDKSTTGKATHVLVFSLPMMTDLFLDNVPEGARKILITTWESDRLHPNTSQALNERWDRIVVPCEWNARTMVSSGVNPHKLIVMPYAFPPEWWSDMRAVKNHPSQNLDRPYAFYSIGTWTDRKNPLGNLLAYLAEFDGDENVSFTHVANSYNRDELLRLLDEGHIENPPTIKIIGVSPNTLSDEDIRQLHRESDCYVTLARAEGWGLGAFEATLAGNPVIATDYSGLREFLQYYKGHNPVPYQLTPCREPWRTNDALIRACDRDPKHVLGKPTGFLYRQNWADPDICIARYWMRKLFKERNRTNYRDLAYEGVLASMTHEAIGQRFKFILERL